MSPPPDRRDVRSWILERRARFVAAALAGAGLAAGVKACAPCLSVVPAGQPSDAATGRPADDDGTAAADDGDGAATVCLEVDCGDGAAGCGEPQPRPAVPPARPCLSIPPPSAEPEPSPPAHLEPPDAGPRVCLRSELPGPTGARVPGELRDPWAPDDGRER